MNRIAFALALTAAPLVVGCTRKQEATPEIIDAAKAAPTVAASASASASASAGAKAACTPLKWNKDSVDVDGTVSFEGTVGKGEGVNATNVTEKFPTLALDKPACGVDGKPVAEVQLYTNDKSIALDKLVGKRVAIEGSAFAEHTAHHHRPIVVEVKKLAAK